jgi:hypothetical protein
MVAENVPCPVCGLDGSVCGIMPDGRGIGVECKRCGVFGFSRTAMELIQRMQGEDLQLLKFLSCHIRQQNSLSITPFFLHEDWQVFAGSHQNTAVSAKISKLIDLIASHTKYPGQEISLESNYDYPLIDASSLNEMIYLMNHLTFSQLVQGEFDSVTKIHRVHGELLF